MSSEGISDRKLAERLGVNKKRVARWRRRWAQAQERLEKAEQVGATNADLKALIKRILSDLLNLFDIPIKLQGAVSIDAIVLAADITGVAAAV